MLHKAQVGKVLFPLTRQMANFLSAYYIEVDLPGLSRKSMDTSAELHFKIKHQQTNALKSNSFWSFMFSCYKTGGLLNLCPKSNI